MTTNTTVPARLTGSELIRLLADEKSFRSWDSEPIDTGPDADYASDLSSARLKSGVDEAIITGEGRINGRRVAIVTSEFGFLAGSIGIAAAERLVIAIEKATQERIPLLASTASGGTRMQEGTLAFVAMIKISAAIAQHKKAGLPYLVYLRNPTTGGVFASWGSLGHVTVAEPGALIGFLGPRVYAAIYDEQFPDGIQTAENLYQKGLIDGILTPEDLPSMIDRVLNVLCPSDDTTGHPLQPNTDGIAVGSAWDSVIASRRNSRPGIRALLHYGADDVVPLNGSGQGGRDPGFILALGRFGGASCVIIAQDRRAQRGKSALGPAALRGARRGMKLADELGLPLVSVIDTPGAALSKEAEEGGLAGQIARCLSELVLHRGITISLILGEGTGGGALALLPADRALAAKHAWLSPLPPEGASAIIFRDVEHAAQMAQKQGIGAAELLHNGVIDSIIPEYPDAADEIEPFCRRVATAIEYEIAALSQQGSRDRMGARLERYRRLGLTQSQQDA